MKLRLDWLVVLTVLVLLGCNRAPQLDIPRGRAVSGKVIGPTGNAVTLGRVFLKPLEHGYIAFGDIQKDGSFTLINQREEKSVVPGKYRVYIHPNDSDRRAFAAAVPTKYHHPDSDGSDLEVNITEDNPSIDIRLRR